MKSRDKATDKVQKICDQIRNETLEPAKKEAGQIIEDAKREAEKILEAAREQAKELESNVREEIEKERSIFESSLSQACKQAMESLRQEIAAKLFNNELKEQLKKEASDPKVIAKLISAVIKAIEKEGTSAKFEVLIPSEVPAKQVAAELTEAIMKKIKDGDLETGNFSGGTRVRIAENHFTADVSTDALYELVADYLRKDFRSLLFNA